MKFHHSSIRVIAILLAVTFFAAACGGDSTEEASTEAAEPTVVGAIPTTAPVTAPSNDNGVSTGADDDAVEAETVRTDDPWEVTVLHVNEDVQIVPVFDGPNGDNITLYDVNTVTGDQLEYPLYAETVFGNRLALLVEEYDDSGAWAKVQVPVRPNGKTVWVQTAFFSEDKHSYRITIDVSENLVRVFNGETELIQGGQIAVTGRDGRETPIVRSYIDEKIPGASLSPAYGDWVLSIAAFSEKLPTFGSGGMPKLALHGTDQPELMGQYVSSGCIRVPNEVISFIADTVPVGTIVDIVP